jgi:hypothetical protein
LRARACRAQKTAAKKAAADKKGKAAGGAARDEGILSDPLAEKLRQQRLQEASDLEHAKAAFGEPTKNVDELHPRTEAVRDARFCAPRCAPRPELSHSGNCAGLHGVWRAAVRQVLPAARGTCTRTHTRWQAPVAACQICAACSRR